MAYNKYAMKQFFILAAASCLILSCKPTPVEHAEKPDEPQPKPAVSVTLDKENLSLKTGETETLTATVEPADATDVVVWSSSDEEVAAVEDGVVRALTAGTATVTAKAGTKSATCKVTVSKLIVLNAVDLGLSVLWADRNLGADSPEEYGDYYAWGETQTRSYYDWDQYKWSSGSRKTLTKYNTRSEYGAVDNLTRLDFADDAAYVATGGKWRIPTKAEFQELLNGTVQTWKEFDEVNGQMFKSLVSDAFIFIPAGGAFIKSEVQSAGKHGCIVSSDICAGSNGYGYKDDYCWYLYFDSGGCIIYGDTRARGWTIRPVMDKPAS